MCEIRRKPGFLPGATWLIACAQGYVGTVQGVMDQGPIGAIQNVGVLPDFRGMGLGRALVRRPSPGSSRRAAPGLPGSHRRERRRRPALSRSGFPPGQDALQSDERLTACCGTPARTEAVIASECRDSSRYAGLRKAVLSGLRFGGVCAG